jgi:predicted Fe-Mo cluster-binding NifX family protein
MRYRTELSVAATSGEYEKVGVTVWGRRISPVFDAARTLQIVELNGGKPVDFRQVQLTPGRTDEVIRLLRECGAKTLICGAISAEPARKIEEGNIRLISFITGKTEQVLAWYGGGGLIGGYQMPGCHGQGRGRNGHCCWRGDIPHVRGPGQKKNR